jgi:hypothetical protein
VSKRPRHFTISKSNSSFCGEVVPFPPHGRRGLVCNGNGFKTAPKGGTQSVIREGFQHHHHPNIDPTWSCL